jgi:hypothetical protein
MREMMIGVDRKRGRIRWSPATSADPAEDGRIWLLGPSLFLLPDFTRASRAFRASILNSAAALARPNCLGKS